MIEQKKLTQFFTSDKPASFLVQRLNPDYNLPEYFTKPEKIHHFAGNTKDCESIRQCKGSELLAIGSGTGSDRGVIARYKVVNVFNGAVLPNAPELKTFTPDTRNLFGNPNSCHIHVEHIQSFKANALCLKHDRKLNALLQIRGLTAVDYRLLQLARQSLRGYELPN